MDFDRVQEYVISLVPPRAPVLQEMERVADETNFPIVGPPSGQLCYLLARAIGARRVFELGSGYGYSTAWFCRAVKENGGGEVYHVVWSDELSSKARKYLGDMGYSDIVQFHVSEAIAALKGTPGPFDLIFNDINKDGYPESLPVIKQKLRSGGLLIIDNMLMSGAIFNPDDRSAANEGVRKFTADITQDPDFIVSLVPVRDGLIVAYRR